MGRHTCAVLPEAINSARTGASFGCIGNRVYTGADDTEAYFAIPGSQLGDQIAIEMSAQIPAGSSNSCERLPPAVPSAGIVRK